MSIPSGPVDSFPDRPAADGFSGMRAATTVLRWLLVAFAAWYFVWPVYRAFANVEIDTNEGWNAYLADAAMGARPLYPSLDKLITNNYPPISFYLVGGVGRLVGDPILAGRLLSLAAVLGIGVAVAVAIRALGGDRAGAGLGGVVFVVTIAYFCDSYVGMDDPQLLAQAIMCAGFAAFLRAEAGDRSCLGPILLMAGAGFVKHNIIAMPVTAFLWLALRRPREAVKCALVSGAAVALGFAVCFALYGRDFFANMLIARQTSWARAFSFAAGDLNFVALPLAITLVAGCLGWRQRGPRLCLIFALVAMGVWWMQRAGEGVDVNATFDLMIAVSMGTGVAFSQAARIPRGRLLHASVLQFVLVLALGLRFVPTGYDGPDPTFRVLFDPSLKKEVAIREAAMAGAVAVVRATPCAVMSSTFVCYRAGKLSVDEFNVEQRMATGALPPTTLQALIDTGQLAVFESDLRANWDDPAVPPPTPSE